MASAATAVYSRSALVDDLRALGLAEGDAVLVRVALKAVGAIEGGPAETLIGALLDAVGPAGTILGLSHTQAVERRFAKDILFDRDTRAITGGFVAAMLECPGAVRSEHPTNSMVAIGSRAVELLEGHDETSTCFAPIRHLIDADGKMILIGCIDSSPGFSTVHLVYEELGLAQRSLVSKLYGSWYERAGERRWFAKRDVPGCSMGFGHLYPDYRRAEALREGTVGDAASMLIRAKDAYAIERLAIKRNPAISLCDNPECLSCRGTKLFNLKDMPRFYARRPRALARLVRAHLLRLVHDRH